MVEWSKTSRKNWHTSHHRHIKNCSHYNANRKRSYY